VLQGLGGGGLMALSQALIGEHVPPRERGRYQAWLATVFVGASSLGPVAGGFLTEHFGWRSVFLVNLPIGVAAGLLLMRLAPGRPAGGRISFDYLGTVLFVATVTPLLLALSLAQSLSLKSVPMLAALVVLSAVAAWLLWRQERRVRSPLIPVSLLRDKTIWRAALLGSCIGGIIVPLVSYTPIYMQVVRGFTPSETGLLLLPMTVGISVGSMITGQLIAKTGRLPIFPSIGQPAVCLLMVALAVLLPVLPVTSLVGVLCAASVFTGTGMVVVQTLTQLIAGSGQLGTIAASVQLARSLGAAFGAAIVGTVLFAALAAQDRTLATVFGELLERGQAVLGTMPAERVAAVRAELGDAFRAAYITIAAVAACGALLAWTIPKRRI
jgi:MFS family permease